MDVLRLFLENFKELSLRLIQKFAQTSLKIIVVSSKVFYNLTIKLLKLLYEVIISATKELIIYIKLIDYVTIFLIIRDYMWWVVFFFIEAYWWASVTQSLYGTCFGAVSVSEMFIFFALMGYKMYHNTDVRNSYIDGEIINEKEAKFYFKDVIRVMKYHRILRTLIVMGISINIIYFNPQLLEHLDANPELLFEESLDDYYTMYRDYRNYNACIFGRWGGKSYKFTGVD